MDDILKLLKSDARLSAAQIAQRTGRSQDEVVAAIAKLEKDKVILGYQAILDPERSEDGLVRAIIEVKIAPERGTGFDAIAERIYKFPEVRTCYLMSGAYDLHVIVEGASLKEVAGFVSQRLATIEHVTSTATHFILKKYKDFGVVMHDTETQERLAITP